MEVTTPVKGQANKVNEAELESTVIIGFGWVCEGFKATPALC